MMYAIGLYFPTTHAHLLKMLTICALLFMVIQANNVVASTACAPVSWPMWEQFKVNYIEPSGRVVAGNSRQLESFSEGQAYGMMFALIANDPKTFELLWKWSIANLAQGNIEAQLPAWNWGQANDGTWKILDENSASDADLWYAYALLEAGRIWQRNDYIDDAKKILAQVKTRTIATLPGLGKMLLPGPIGFAVMPNQWQLNPSYLPISILRKFAAFDSSGPWNELAKNTAKMISASSPKGFTPDWVGYQGLSPISGKFIVDPIKGDIGSYDAIRVYLWAGMTDANDPLAQPILKSLQGMEKILKSNSTPPERVNTVNGATSGAGPVGFSAALLPYLKAMNKSDLLQAQLERIKNMQLTKPLPVYYDSVLNLFGMGWFENRYRFSSNGLISLNWNQACTQKIN